MDFLGLKKLSQCRRALTGIISKGQRGVHPHCCTDCIEITETMYDLGSDRQVAKVSLSLSVMASIKYETAKMLQASKEDFANQWATSHRQL